MNIEMCDRSAELEEMLAMKGTQAYLSMSFIINILSSSSLLASLRPKETYAAAIFLVFGFWTLLPFCL